MFSRLRWAVFAVFFLLSMGVGGCQNAPQTAAVTLETTDAPSPTSLPVVSPSPASARQPTAQPQPAAVFATPLPPLPTDAALSWEAPLPVLHGAVDNAAALRQTLQAMLSYERALWVAAWPEDFPTDLPLPPQGWLVLAAYGRYDVEEEWSLYLDVPADKASWLQAFEVVLQQAQWEKAPNLEPTMFLPADKADAWCDPKGEWMLTMFAAAQGEKHTLAHLIYQHAPAPNLGCGPESMGMFAGPPKGFPTLKAPPGTVALSGEESGGDPQNWVARRRFRSPDGLQPLLESFTEQLAQQGWQIQAMAAGTLWEGKAAYARGHREGDVRPDVGLLILGETPLFDVWLWSGDVPPMPPAPPGPGDLPELHGNTDNPVALRRALALSQWQALNPGVTSVQIWIGEAPDPWPVPVLPQPQRAQWASTMRKVYPDTGEEWTFRFRVPGTVEDVQEALKDLLAQAGWEALSSDAFSLPPDAQMGFLPAVAQDNLLANTFCHDGPATLMVEYASADAHSTLVTWHYVSDPGPCRQMRMMGPGGMPMIAAPVLTLTLAPDDVISNGGLSPWGYDFSKGYLAHAFWWSYHALDDQQAAFADQFAAQGWVVRGQGMLGEDLVWIQGTKDDEGGKTWRASVTVLRVGEGYFWGVLTVTSAGAQAEP